VIAGPTNCASTSTHQTHSSSTQCSSRREDVSQLQPLSERTLMKVFDYIVASDCTAGSVFAPRLSQDPGTRVLLVEAGSANGIPRELG
jgi:hypothetical protein